MTITINVTQDCYGETNSNVIWHNLIKGETSRPLLGPNFSLEPKRTSKMEYQNGGGGSKLQNECRRFEPLGNV